MKAVIWQDAVLFADPENDWIWTKVKLMGLPALVRVLLTLGRAGIRAVHFPLSAVSLKSELEYWQDKKDLPQLNWWNRLDPEAALTNFPLLGVRGGILFEPKLIHRFQQAIQNDQAEKAFITGAAALPVLLSLSFEKAKSGLDTNKSFDNFSSEVEGPAFEIPADVFCRHLQELRGPDRERELLLTVGKPTDRWHVRWVRRWTFPGLRLLAQLGLTPNQISWTGFMVGILACVLIAQGTYWSGVLGALLLYGSWVLDCVDGTLARLTFSESPLGHRLDTILGHLTNLLTFGAIIWAVYGDESAWKAAAYGFFVLGSLIVAHSVAQAQKKRRSPTTRKAGFEKIQGFLDKINHRDYAVWIFLFALMGGLRFFLWGSIIGIQVYWMMHLWLIFIQHREPQAS